MVLYIFYIYLLGQECKVKHFIFSQVDMIYCLWIFYNCILADGALGSWSHVLCAILICFAGKKSLLFTEIKSSSWVCKLWFVNLQVHEPEVWLTLDLSTVFIVSTREEKPKSKQLLLCSLFINLKILNIFCVMAVINVYL